MTHVRTFLGHERTVPVGHPDRQAENKSKGKSKPKSSGQKSSSPAKKTEQKASNTEKKASEDELARAREREREQEQWTIGQSKSYLSEQEGTE